MPNIVYIATSLDGLIADSAGRVDWAAPYEDADYGFETFYAGVDRIIMGRRTYDQTLRLGDWPYAGKPVTVLTHRPLRAPPIGISAFCGPLTKILTRASRRTNWIIGGSQTIAAAIRDDLVDEFDIFVMPLTLGQGIPLFADELPALDLRPVGNDRFENGVVRLRYKVPAATGPAHG